MIGLNLLSAFVKHSRNNFTENIPQLISGILQLFIHNNEELRLCAWNTLRDIMSIIGDSDLPQYIDWYRTCIRSMELEREKGSLLFGFCISRGLSPIMNMFDYGIRNGTICERSSAAKLMADLILLTDLQSIRPFLNKIAGALIRICADRYPSSVKCSILQTLTLLISTYGELMKGFYTPLQTTFVKVIQDPSRDVRYDASRAILSL
eukprot:727995_1